jgi:hypothetical protein
MLPFKRRDGKVDLRRKHPHFLVTVVYIDSQEFVRVYNHIQKAEKFAARQERSPVVKTTRVNRIR